MQNRYVGDIGDYVKLGILRALSPGHRLGVAWWLYPDEAHNDDGRHIDYLKQREQWRHFDPALFDALAKIVTSGERDVRSLEVANILPGAIFASETIPVVGTIAERLNRRQKSFTTVQHALDGADLPFVDPDNGLEPEGYGHGSATAGKSVLLSELRALARPGRCLIVYHHQTRRKGGHHAEMEHWADRLRECIWVLRFLRFNFCCPDDDHTDDGGRPWRFRRGGLSRSDAPPADRSAPFPGWSA